MMNSLRTHASPAPHRTWRAGAAVVGAMAFVLAGQVAPAAVAAGCAGSSMYVSAHEDDTFLFMAPDLLHGIQAGGCVQTVFVTAGDANRDETYWSGREDGAKASYATMAGQPDSWLDSSTSVLGHEVRVSRLAGDPDVSLVFLRLPDGAGVAG